MNIDSGIIKPEDDLTAEERLSGRWMKLPPDYRPKTNPVTDGERARLLAAEEKRLRKMERRLREARQAAEIKSRNPRP